VVTENSLVDLPFLEVRVHSGTLKTAETLTIAMVEKPDQPDADPESIVADFLELLEDAATTDQ
jgi:hypothetical protein